MHETALLEHLAEQLTVTDSRTDTDHSEFAAFVMKRHLHRVDEIPHAHACPSNGELDSPDCTCGGDERYLFGQRTATDIIADAKAHGIDVAADLYGGFVLDNDHTITPLHVFSF